MTEQEIQDVLAESTGRPVSGVLHDAIPAMAAAMYRALHSKKTGAPSGDAIGDKRHPSSQGTRDTVSKLPKPCLDCGRLSPGTRCDGCRLTKQRQRDEARGPRPHYSGDYQRRAKAVRDSATVCWICGKEANPEDVWTADHLVAGDPASPLLAAHRKCNSSRGNRW
jgi:hypothetical protein